LKIRRKSKMLSWHDRKATQEEMLEDVQNLKDEAVQAMFKGRVSEAGINKKIDEFMQANRMQILDILDDAIYAHINGKL
jgi:hypothetical protein